MQNNGLPEDYWEAESDRLLEECLQFLDSDPKKAKLIAQRVIELVSDTRHRDKLGKAYAYLARALYNIDGAGKTSMDTCLNAIRILEDLGSSSTLGMAWLNLGNCHGRQGDVLASRDCYQKAKDIYNDSEDRNGEAAALNGLGISYEKMEFHDNALTCYKEANKIGKEIGKKLVQAVTLNNIADILIDDGELNEAKKCLEQSIELNRSINRRIGVAHCLTNLGRIQMEIGELENAQKHLIEADSLWSDIGSRDLRIPSLLVLADIHEKQKNTDKAIEVLNKALEISIEVDNSLFTGQIKQKLGTLLFALEEEQDAEKQILDSLEILQNKDEGIDYMEMGCSILAEYYENSNDLEKALKYQKLVLQYHNELMNREMEHDLQKMKLRLEYQSVEMKREALAQKNEELTKALAEVRTLQGLFPICVSCKKIRDDTGFWEQIEEYITNRSDAQFSHGICPECMKKLYPEYELDS